MHEYDEDEDEGDVGDEDITTEEFKRKFLNLQLKYLFNCQKCQDCRERGDDAKDKICSQVEPREKIDCLRNLCPTPCERQLKHGEPPAEAIWRALSGHIYRLTDATAGMLMQQLLKKRNEAENRRN